MSSPHYHLYLARDSVLFLGRGRGAAPHFDAVIDHKTGLPLAWKNKHTPAKWADRNHAGRERIARPCDLPHCPEAPDLRKRPAVPGTARPKGRWLPLPDFGG